MEVYQLRVFLEVARHLSFTEAADALNLTQPAVSAKIKSLELELGAPLFHRSTRKIQLSEVGEFLLAEGPKLIQLENQLLQKVAEIKQGKAGKLNIGCMAAIADSWLPQIIFTYRQQHPGIQTHCLTFDSVESLYRAITSNQVDLGVSDINFQDFSEISATAIETINYSLFTSKNHELAKQNWLSLQELKKSPLVIFATGSPSRLIFESRLAELGLACSDFPQLEIVDTASIMRTYILQGYLGFASNFDFKSECQLGVLVPITLQEFALSGNVYLLSLKRSLSDVVNPNQSSRRSRSLNPSQKFTALIQGCKQQLQPISSSPPVKLRSPSFTIYSGNSQRSEPLTLSIGIQNGTIPTITAGLLVQRLGLLEHFLPKDGRYSATRYQIQWRDFPTGAPIVAGLHSGQLDIGILGDYPLLLSAVASINAKRTCLVSFVSINPDGSCSAAIVPKQSQIESITDMRGRAIAVPFGSAAHGMVMRSLNAAKLLESVSLTSLEPANPTDLFIPKQLADGYAHFAPFHQIACRQGKFRYLSQSDDELPAFYGVVASSAIAERHPEVVVAYLKAISAAQYWYDTTPNAPTLVSRWTQLETEIVAQILNSSYQPEQPGRFFSEMTIRPDWLNLHITQLSQIPNNTQLSRINLNNWIQPEFLQQIDA